ncbi:MAG TPA: hypothetical protein VNE38_03340 [Ktedonobacteraceae bacterium]|nr:hypothetical protein [Ktedonobacteraceae bacterium]
MNRRDRHGEPQQKSSHGAPHQKRYIHPRSVEPPVEAAGVQANFAYQLLLLQQRLAAYEQLHLEEIAELQQEIERLRRAFLQETSPDLRAISPRTL